jgi:ATP-binding cassette subfamily B multidrug efflux pump
MGSHQQLLVLRGIYYKLYQLQYKDQEANIGAGAASPPKPAATTVSADD